MKIAKIKMEDQIVLTDALTLASLKRDILVLGFPTDLFVFQSAGTV